jgi:peptidoglycan/xylan/chitin deacetylase (PgdA/CDA1 family)
MYHRIVAAPQSVYDRTPAQFRAELDRLAAEDYVPVTAKEVATRAIDIPAGKHPVVLTFDDGWKNVLNAVPILDRYRMKASFWIITGAGIGHDYLEWGDVEQLARNPLFQVESHTVSHPWNDQDNLVTWLAGSVAGKDAAAVRAELVDSKATLEARLGRRVDYLAWPVGWYTEELVRMAKEAGYRALLTAEDGANAPGDDVFHIKRVFVDGACDLASFRRLLKEPAYRPCQTSGRSTHGHMPPKE